MNRPYIVCHMMQSVDGRVACNMVAKSMEGSSKPGKQMVVFFSHTGENYNAGNIEKGNTHIVAKSHVDAAVFGEGRHTWPLRLDFDWRKIDGQWKIMETRAHTF